MHPNAKISKAEQIQLKSKLMKEGVGNLNPDIQLSVRHVSARQTCALAVRPMC